MCHTCRGNLTLSLKSHAINVIFYAVLAYSGLYHSRYDYIGVESRMQSNIAWRYRTHACGVRVRCAILYVFLHLALDVKVPRSFSKLLKITILGEISGRGVLENVTDAHYYMDTTDVLDKHCPHTPIVHSNAVTCYEI